MRDNEKGLWGNARCSRAVRFAALLASVTMLGACDKATGGQVVAVVNDTEITQQELRLEAEAQGATGNATIPAAAREGLVQRIVERNLLADYARREGLDKGPEYVIRRRLLEQTLLATLAARKLSGTQVTPGQADVRAYIDGNPTLFAGRQRLGLDQIRFATPADGKKIQSLVSLGSMAAVAAQLEAERVPFQRGAAALDTASVAPEIARQIVGLPNGRTFDITSGGTTYISAVTGRAPIASDPSTWTAAATEALRRADTGKRVTTAVEQLRKDAKITYDPAFQPAAKKP